MPRQTHTCLTEWLTWQEQFHSKEIDLGLDRVRSVFQRMSLEFGKTKFITVAGTNGKGSTVAFLSQIYRQANYHVGTYTSPHLIEYNERIVLDGVNASDEQLCEAFDKIDQARCVGSEISLTYFEFGVLAALYMFSQSGVDVAILEVGLGGRLDAANLIDPDCAIVTSIGIDHRDWLGDTREKIGFEKAGIFRSGIPCISGDIDTPDTVSEYADSIKAIYLEREKHFFLSSKESEWKLHFNNDEYSFPLPALKAPIQLNNAACAVVAALKLQNDLPLKHESIAAAIEKAKIQGRMQLVSEKPKVILDVAHNEDSAKALVESVKRLYPDHSVKIVLGMLKDKEVEQTVNILRELKPSWIAVTPNSPRALAASDLLKLTGQGESIDLNKVKDILENQANDLSIVTGSFFVVSEILKQYKH